MTSTELYEIVKDVPREAWPVRVFFSYEDDEQWSFQAEHQSDPCPTLTVLAELAFVGSMVRHMTARGYFLINSGVGWAVLQDVGHAGMWYPSEIEALAAACKAVKP